MIKRIVIWSAGWLIIVGTVAWAVFYLSSGQLPTFVTEKTIDYGYMTHTLYVLDVNKYLKALELNVNVPLKEMFPKIPSMPAVDWDNFGILDLGKLLVNFIIWMVNMWIWNLNLTMIVPTKLLLQPIILILSLLGIDLQKYGIITVVYALYILKPPLIPYL